MNHSPRNIVDHRDREFTSDVYHQFDGEFHRASVLKNHIVGSNYYNFERHPHLEGLLDK